MKFACPACSKSLNIPDQFAGKKARCPGCKEVFEAPRSVGESEAVVAEAPPMPRPVGPPPLPPRASDSAAVQKGTPPRAAKSVCPECGESLARGETSCESCGWGEDEVRRQPKRDSAAEGCCYVDFRGDDVDFTEGVEKRLKYFFETEQLDMEIVAEEAPERLGERDLAISGTVRSDFGSQFMRYLLTFITMWGGPGACKLNVEAEMETDEEGRRRIDAKSHVGAGVFGGSSANLMKINVKNVANKIATQAIKHLTGKSFLNSTAYDFAKYSLILGLIGLIPLAGPFFAVPGIILGIIALVTISKRRLPRRKTMAIFGIALSVLGLFVTVGAFFLATFG